MLGIERIGWIRSRRGEGSARTERIPSIRSIPSIRMTLRLWGPPGVRDWTADWTRTLSAFLLRPAAGGEAPGATHAR